MTTHNSRTTGEANPSLPRAHPGIPAWTGEGLPRLSFGQQRLWIMAQMEGGNPSYNVAYALRLSGDLDAAALQRALDRLVERHAILRTRYPLVDSEPRQEALPRLDLRLERIDLRHLDADQRQPEALRQAAEHNRGEFDLQHGPLLRAGLWQCGAQDYVFLLIFHHSIIDEWSLGVLNDELSQVYAAEIAAAPPELPPLRTGYADFAEWQRQWMQGDVLERQLAYWRARLDGAPQAIDLPVDFPHPAQPGLRGGTRQRLVAAGILSQLKQVCRAEQATVYTGLLAAFYALLYRYTGQADLPVGTPVANRRQAGLERMVGFFLNTVVLRGDLRGDPNFADLLQRVNQAVWEAFDYQDLPFEKLVEALSPQREAGRSPLFQVMFVYQPPLVQPLRLSGVQTEPLRVEYDWAKFDLTLFAAEAPDGLLLSAEYRADLFMADTVDRLLEHYQRLLEGMLADPLCPISAIPMQSEAEVETLRRWNATGNDYPTGMCVHELVEAQVLRTPQAVALQAGPRCLTYLELNQQANRLAHRLRRMGVGRWMAVGIYMPRSAEALLAVLAVLKAGGACLPLDPGYPRARLEWMCADAQLSFVLTLGEMAPAFQQWLAGGRQWVLSGGAELARGDAAGEAGQILCVDQALAGQVDFPAENPGRLAGPDDLAYVLYTSGSTGRPKGVSMGHRPLVNLVSWQLAHFSGPPAARTLQWSSLNFDVAFQETLATWSAGGTLLVVSEAARRDFSALAAYLAGQSIQRLFLPFVALQALAEAVAGGAPLPASLDEVITAGEQLQITPQIAALFERLPGCRLHNQYGPTEAHVVSAYSLAGRPQAWPRLPPVGKPIANTQIHLLDRRGQPAPLGAVGEIYLGGACLAQGYLYRPGLTAERFVPHPFGQPGERLYRSGDLGRYLPDGNIQFLGRADQQVKIRGYRVELAEVEAALAEQNEVRQAVVLARQAQSGGRRFADERRLVAYLVLQAGSPLQAQALRAGLSQRLPEYMIPSAFVAVDALPLTPSGKVDRLALAAREDPWEQGPHAGQGVLGARDALEKALCQIWQEVLGVQQVGVEQDFFELGGNSLLAARLFLRVEQELGQRLPLSTLFAAPTVERLAHVLRRAQQPEGWSPLVGLQPGGERPPFFCVHNFGGEVINLHRLAQALGEAQPFYGLQARGLDGQQPPHTSIAQMAADYLHAIRSIQPQGPYLLGGFCFGGVVAYEMACQLAAQGERVGLVALIDAYAPGRAGTGGVAWQRAADFFGNLSFWWRDFWQLAAADRRIVVHRRLKRMGKAVARRLGRQAEMTPRDLIGEHAHVEEAPGHVRRLMELHMLALVDYSPPEYAGRVTLFRTRRLPLFTPYGPEAGWQGLAQGGVELHIVPGAHHNLLWPPYVDHLAAALQCSLNSAAPQSE